MLDYPDFNQLFKLYTEASGQGLERARGLEKHHSSKLEFLELKWTICKHFSDQLYYAEHFDVYKNTNLLTYIKTSCKLK